MPLKTQHCAKLQSQVAKLFGGYITARRLGWLGITICYRRFRTNIENTVRKEAKFKGLSCKLRNKFREVTFVKLPIISIGILSESSNLLLEMM